MTRIEDEGSLLTVGLHHVRPEIPFDASHARRARALAPSLLACVARHLDWLDAQSVAAVRAVLRQRCAELTERELDVLERLLHGMTYDGIAADMGLSVSTVKTYRARAFRRLNIHFKNELFASLLPRSCHLFG